MVRFLRKAENEPARLERNARSNSPRGVVDGIRRQVLAPSTTGGGMLKWLKDRVRYDSEQMTGAAARSRKYCNQVWNRRGFCLTRCCLNTPGGYNTLPQFS